MVDQNGRATREFYTFFQSALANLQGQIDALADIAKLSKALGSPDGTTQDLIDVQAALEAKVDALRVVTGANSIKGGGSLANDVILQLVGDQADPGISMHYGTDADGNKGWQPDAIPDFVDTFNVPETWVFG